VAFVRVLMLKGTGISPLGSVSVAVAALILGKAVLLADMLPVINRFPDKPLIYNVTWKTIVYLLISFVIHYLERLIDFWRQAGGFIAGNQKLLSEIIWRISGLSRSFCSSSLPRIARFTSWRASSARKRFCEYSSARCLPRKFERRAHGRDQT